jgi:hypothetical protein
MGVICYGRCIVRGKARVTDKLKEVFKIRKINQEIVYEIRSLFYIFEQYLILHILKV